MTNSDVTNMTGTKFCKSFKRFSAASVATCQNVLIVCVNNKPAFMFQDNTPVVSARRYYDFSRCQVPTFLNYA